MMEDILTNVANVRIFYLAYLNNHVITTFYYESILIVWQYFSSMRNNISKTNTDWFEKSNLHIVSKAVIGQNFGQC